MPSLLVGSKKHFSGWKNGSCYTGAMGYFFLIDLRLTESLLKFKFGGEW
ncbi:MAG: hypothetical protein Ct9H300mP27_10550 [Chloroflexota bacterium]|nr:MAG: hypothetical protein Ct9H300mP27_10550 [Chloroflexota bacterium]